MYSARLFLAWNNFHPKGLRLREVSTPLKECFFTTSTDVGRFLSFREIKGNLITLILLIFFSTNAHGFKRLFDVSLKKTERDSETFNQSLLPLGRLPWLMASPLLFLQCHILCRNQVAPMNKFITAPATFV